jgi:hypothetical protein
MTEDKTIMIYFTAVLQYLPKWAEENHKETSVKIANSSDEN